MCGLGTKNIFEKNKRGCPLDFWGDVPITYLVEETFIISVTKFWGQRSHVWIGY